MSVGAGGATGALGTGAVINNAALQFNRTGALTVANAISGSGAVNQVGTSTTSLTGANTYSGTTTISAGILSVGAGGTTGTLGTGAVVNNGTLQINRSDAITVANTISGTGALTKLAAGHDNADRQRTATQARRRSRPASCRSAPAARPALWAPAPSINNATLQLNRSDATFTSANNISGTGALTKTAAGTSTTLILTGDQHLQRHDDDHRAARFRSGQEVPPARSAAAASSPTAARWPSTGRMPSPSPA